MIDYPEYKKDLQRIHESEVYGCALFNTAAQVTLSPKQKKKWLVLKALEEQTLERYLSYMKDSGQPVTAPKGWELKGYFEGAMLGVLPWRLSMKLLGDGTAPFQEKFLRLKNNATEKSEKKFFGYVYAHEKAIEAFAHKEMSRDQDSLKAAESLLNN
ncbi:MAG: hypothetical protein HQM11_21415 [SAR324 cluster bacterium]|nr:hypothetical protein [SAR324 cluster bacterium]